MCTMRTRQRIKEQAGPMGRITVEKSTQGSMYIGCNREYDSVYSCLLMYKCRNYDTCEFELTSISLKKV